MKALAPKLHPEFVAGHAVNDYNANVPLDDYEPEALKKANRAFIVRAHNEPDPGQRQLPKGESEQEL